MLVRPTSILCRICTALAAILGLALPLSAAVCTIGPSAGLPPQCLEGNGYVSPYDDHELRNGLSPGSSLRFDIEDCDFSNITVVPDGLGAEVQNYQSTLAVHITGTGVYS